MPLPGLRGVRAIVLNTNFFISENFYTWISDDSDVGGSLAWFEKQLAATAAAGEKAFVLFHEPNGGLLANASNTIRALISAYRDSIVALFHGHTHNDEFNIFFDATTAGAAPVVPAYTAPSVDIRGGHNPR